MWLIPLLVIGALVVAAASRSPREALAAPRQLGLPPAGPISVLGEFVRVGQVPPPPVILCAIAEAEALGRDDIADRIVRTFVEPVVRAHDQARGASGYARGSCAPLPASPRAAMAIPAPKRSAAVIPSSAADIQAMMDADPAGFVQMIARGGMPTPPIIDVPAAPAVPAAPQAAATAAQPTGLPSETVAQMQEEAGLPTAADETRANALPSPIEGISDEAWRQFVRRLEREPLAYASARHVGRYRQRRDRLAELGIDPRALGSAEAQRAAIDTDLADAHHHAAAAGLVAEHLGHPIALPGQEGSTPLTLSGLLGVIQCAGLEGAVGWLERPGDRKKYPHTTQAFMNTNGAF